jgi:hypothetical protein
MLVSGSVFPVSSENAAPTKKTGLQSREGLAIRFAIFQ